MQRKKFVKLEENYSGEVFYKKKNITEKVRRLGFDIQVNWGSDLDSELERVAREAKICDQANAYSEPPQPLELAAIYAQYRVRPVHFYQIDMSLIGQNNRTTSPKT